MTVGCIAWNGIGHPAQGRLDLAEDYLGSINCLWLQASRC